MKKIMLIQNLLSMADCSLSGTNWVSLLVNNPCSNTTLPPPDMTKAAAYIINITMRI